MSKNTFKVAFCGVVSALAVVMMFCTGLIPVGTYAFPCFAGMLLCPVVIEFGLRWAYCAYAAISLLSLLIAGDKEAVLYFIVFFGFYPILKASIERIKSKLYQYIIKYAVFNICIIAAFLLAKFILMIPDDEFNLLGFYVPWIFLIIGNVFFLIYDRCVTVMVLQYIHRIRPKLN